MILKSLPEPLVAELILKLARMHPENLSSEDVKICQHAIAIEIYLSLHAASRLPTLSWAAE